MTRQFSDSKAVRSKVPLLIGLVSASGAGKTFSALRLATGIVKVTGGKIYYVDTEADRALHYADKFDFQHVPFAAPFNPLAYLEVAKYCRSKNDCGVIVYDSFSHEHSGVGGVLDMHEQELDRLSKGDLDKRERVGALAWGKPKQERARMIDGLIQMNANFIFCFRAQEKLDWKKKDDRGQPTDLGWQPIGAMPMIYEMTARCLLQPGSEGVPDWEPPIKAEKQLVKRPEQFRKLFAEYKGKQIDERMGSEMAKWATGDAQGETVKESIPSPFGELIASIAMAKDLDALNALTTNLESCKRERRVTPQELEQLRGAWLEQKKKLEATG